MGAQVQVRTGLSKWYSGTIVAVNGTTRMTTGQDKTISRPKQRPEQGYNQLEDQDRRRDEDNGKTTITFDIAYDDTGHTETDVPRLRIRCPGQAQPQKLLENEQVDGWFRLQQRSSGMGWSDKGDDPPFNCHARDAAIYCSARVIKIHKHYICATEESVRTSGQNEPATNNSDDIAHEAASVDASLWAYDLEYDDGERELRVPRCWIEAQHRDDLKPGEHFTEVDANAIRWSRRLWEKCSGSKDSLVKTNSRPLPRLPLCQRKLLFRMSEWIRYKRNLVVVAGLPSQKQLWNFVLRVADHHSWYKHLPIQRISKFQFACSLASGMRLGTKGHVEFTEDDGTHFHYTWKTTAQYRENFHFFDWSHEPRSIAASKLQDSHLITRENATVCLPRMENSAILSALVHSNNICLLTSAFNMYQKDPVSLQDSTPPEAMEIYSRNFISLSSPLPFEVLRNFDAILQYLSQRREEGGSTRNSFFTNNLKGDERLRALALLHNLFPKANKDQIEQLLKTFQRVRADSALLAQHAERARQRLAMAEALSRVCVETFGNHPQFKLDLGSKEATNVLYEY